MNYTLEFTYDEKVKEITAIEDCDVVYRLKGGGGGGGGYDSPYQGSAGLNGGDITGIISLSAGEKLYCAVGDGGKRGIAGGGARGGSGGKAIEGYAGGAGGNSGPAGWSGSGGGGGGATVLWKLNGSIKEIIAVAAGGGGGGGGGHYSSGYIKQESPWGFTTGNRGGKGDDHPGDGGGPGGGGGGGFYSYQSEYVNMGLLPLGGGTSWRSSVLRNYHAWHVGGTTTTLYVNFPSSGIYKFVAASDDIGSMLIDGVDSGNRQVYDYEFGWLSNSWVEDGAYDIAGYNQDITYNINIPAAGWRKIKIYAANTGGGPYGFAIRIFRQSDNIEIWNTRSSYTILKETKSNGGGQGGTAPGGDGGAMSGSTGYSYTPYSYTTDIAISAGYANRGNGGSQYQDGYSGYAGFSAIQRNISKRNDYEIKVPFFNPIRIRNWQKIDRVYIRNNSQWVEPNGVYVYTQGQWKKTYGPSTPSYVSVNQTFDNISGPRV